MVMADLSDLGHGKNSSVKLEVCSLKDVSNFLMQDILREQNPNDPNDDNLSDSPLVSLKCETMSPTTDWKRTWRLVRSIGLGPELTSFVLKNQVENNPHKVPTPQDPPYSLPELKLSALWHTPDQEPGDPRPRPLHLQGQPGTPSLKLLSTLQGYQPGAQQCTVLTLDLEVEPSIELPFTWIIGSLLLSIWTKRDSGRVDLAKTRAHLEAKSRIMRDSKAKTWANASTLTEAIIVHIFND